MSIQERPLSTVLDPFARKEYQTLFSPQGGFLVWNSDKNHWQIQKSTPDNPVQYYNEIIDRLIATKAYREIPNTEAFVRRLNHCRTLEVVAPPPFAATTGKAATVYFNSKDPNHNFLSNFHQTLILFPDPLHPHEICLYPSSENAYQAHKVGVLFRQLGPNPKAEEGLSDEQPDEGLLGLLATLPPAESKELASASAYLENSDELAGRKYELMLQIVTRKFQDNPILSDWLRKTGSEQLVENTNDNFWGSKDPYDRSLSKSYRLPISMESRNVLGRILMEVRGLLK